MRPDKHLEVLWWDGSAVGHLVNRGSIYFVYDAAWLKRGLNLSPLSLPFTEVAFNGAKGVDGLPGLIADCLPDTWGRKVAAREFRRNNWGEPTPLGLLSWRGSGGIGPLAFRPAKRPDGSPGNQLLESVSAAALARAAAAIHRGEPDEVIPQLARGGSAGGMQPKALVLEHEDGTLSVGPPTPGTRPALIKFDMVASRSMTLCEHAYVRMAAEAGIHTVETKIFRQESPESAHLLIYRFDTPREKPGQRILVHSLAGLLNKEPDALDYTYFFSTGVKLGVHPNDLREIARRMVFNVLASNADDHGKNHAFQLDETSRRWSLTPAFDITYDEAMLERGMPVGGDVWPTIKKMGEMCSEVGVGPEEFTSIVTGVQRAVGKWQQIAAEIGVPEHIITAVAERHARIREVVMAERRRGPRIG